MVTCVCVTVGIMTLVTLGQRSVSNASKYCVCLFCLKHCILVTGYPPSFHLFSLNIVLIHYLIYRKCQSSKKVVTAVALHNCSDMPIYSRESKMLTTAEVMNILLDPDLSEKVVCKKVPFGIDCNSVFISGLGTSRDIVCDDMGSWKWSGSYRVWLSVDEIGDVSVQGKSKPGSPDPQLSYYRIWKRYYENKLSPDLKKIIVTLEGRIMY